MSQGYRREVDQLIRTLRRLGCSVCLSRSGHYKVRLGGGMVVLSSTPSGQRWRRTALHEIRKELGLDLR